MSYRDEQKKAAFYEQLGQAEKSALQAQARLTQAQAQLTAVKAAIAANPGDYPAGAEADVDEVIATVG
jgi:hypothetical protein